MIPNIRGDGNLSKTSPLNVRLVHTGRPEAGNEKISRLYVQIDKRGGHKFELTDHYSVGWASAW